MQVTYQLTPEDLYQGCLAWRDQRKWRKWAAMDRLFRRRGEHNAFSMDTVPWPSGDAFDCFRRNRLRRHLVELDVAGSEIFLEAAISKPPYGTIPHHRGHS